MKQMKAWAGLDKFDEIDVYNIRPYKNWGTDIEVVITPFQENDSSDVCEKCKESKLEYEEIILDKQAEIQGLEYKVSRMKDQLEAAMCALKIISKNSIKKTVSIALAKDALDEINKI